MCKQFIALGKETWKTVLKRQIVSDPRDVMRRIHAITARVRVQAVLDVTDEDVRKHIKLPSCMNRDAFVCRKLVNNALKQRIQKQNVAIIMPLAPDDGRPTLVAYMSEDNKLKTLAMTDGDKTPVAKTFPANGACLRRAETNMTKGCAVYVLEEIITNRQNDHLRAKASREEPESRAKENAR
jgi:hypothetical protein